MSTIDYAVVSLEIEKLRNDGSSPSEIFYAIADLYPAHDLPVNEKVELSDTILSAMTKDERKELAKALIEEQVLKQRLLLNRWSTVTAQSSQIDTGYIAQHLVSLQTRIPGQGMRGKGNDLSDGSEVKSANFLDSLDKKGATAPRWNFNAGKQDIMERFLNYEAIYLLSMDLNAEEKLRIRIWKIDIQKHDILRERYIEWMNKLGYPKFKASDRPSVNFQLFPPCSGTEENCARHGGKGGDGFPAIQIPLENHPGAELVFKAEEVDGEIQISVF